MMTPAVVTEILSFTLRATDFYVNNIESEMALTPVCIEPP
jgi:hypothetical protein